MNLSLLTFTMFRNYPKHCIDAMGLFETASQNDIPMIDILSYEVDLLGEAQVLNALVSSNVRIGCYVTGAPFYTAPEKVTQVLTDALQRAKRLGTKTLMVIPGSGDQNDAEACKKLTKQEMLERAVDCFSTAVQLAKPYNITICFENTPHAFKPLSAPYDCLYVLERVNGLGLVFDTANFRVANTQCDELSAYKLLKRYIVRVHLKDVIIGNFSTGELCVDGQRIRPVVTGSGVIPIEKIICALVKDDYPGDFVVEYCAPVDATGKDHISYLAPYCQFIRQAIGKIK